MLKATADKILRTTITGVQGTNVVRRELCLPEGRVPARRPQVRAHVYEEIGGNPG